MAMLSFEIWLALVLHLWPDLRSSDLSFEIWPALVLHLWLVSIYGHAPSHLRSGQYWFYTSGRTGPTPLAALVPPVHMYASIGKYSVWEMCSMGIISSSKGSSRLLLGVEGEHQENVESLISFLT
ncbi:hypothetical protein DFH29DRAFT_883984 [Suillus ampliporus]|nr:hypothetical protein DFH29DRAFT_883984 [Suillus ampliporus]